jgi:predicted small metal-binding protein
MAKKFLLHCKDLGNADCPKKFTGYNEGEVLMKTIQHIMWDHKVEKVPADEKDRIRSLIKTQE